MVIILWLIFMSRGFFTHEPSCWLSVLCMLQIGRDSSEDNVTNLALIRLGNEANRMRFAEKIDCELLG